MKKKSEKYTNKFSLFLLSFNSNESHPSHFLDRYRLQMLEYSGTNASLQECICFADLVRERNVILYLEMWDSLD